MPESFAKQNSMRVVRKIKNYLTEPSDTVLS